MLGNREANEFARMMAAETDGSAKFEDYPMRSVPVATSMPATVVAAAAMPGSAYRSTQTERERHLWSKLVRTSLAVALACTVLVLIGWHTTAAGARDAKTGTFRSGTYPYFVLCFCGGVVTGLAHLAVTPIDVVKCRIQVGEYGSFDVAFREMFDVECRRQWRRTVPVFFRGWVPTIFGYCGQGAVKFCLYEMFKYAFVAVLSSGGRGRPSALAQTMLFLTASFIAEVLADFALCPWEALKIKIQTSLQSPPPQVSVLIPRIWLQEGWRSFYSGLVPLWFRQVPYTMMKFASFEHIASFLRGVLLRLLGRTTLNSALQLLVTMLAGIFAGVLCAVVSHPADTVLSRLSMRKAERDEPRDELAVLSSTPSNNNGHETTEHETLVNLSMHKSSTAPVDSPLSAREIIRLLGWRGLWRGVGPRIAMVAAITSLQWLLYDAFKVMVGLPASSAAAPPPAAAAAAKSAM